jgi:hypothetical protein
MDELPPTPPTDSIEDNDSICKFESRIQRLEMELENRKLNQESAQRDLLIKEIKQRILLRNFAAALGVIIIVVMAIILGHTVHRYTVGPFIVVSPAIAIAMFVGPITSITTITIMLLIGSFRRFKDDDMENVNVPSLFLEATKAGLGK